MATTAISLGPWPLGIDNVHTATNQVFQVPSPGQPLPRLASALDMDLDDDGWLTTRSGVVQERALSAPTGLWAIGGRLLYQDGSQLAENGTTLVSGLQQRVMLEEHGGVIYGTDGSQHFVLTLAGATNWGLPVPEISVKAGSGALSAGRYLIQASYVDAAGNEGGVCPLVSIDLAEGQSVVMRAAAAPHAIWIRVYASGPNGRQTSFVAEYPANQSTYTLHAVRQTVVLPPVTERMRGPITGAAGIASFRAFLLLWRDNFVMRSEATEPHLFHPDNIMQFPHAVSACVGLTEGLWVGTAEGLWWVTGEGPDAWIPAQRSRTAVWAGSYKLPASYLGAIPGGGLIALFVTAEGLIAGLPSGDVLLLTDQRYRFGLAAYVTLVCAERTNMRQLFIARRLSND